MRSCALAWMTAVLLCGCPGNPVEGSTAGAEGGSTSTDGSATSTVTIGSQSASDSMDSGVSVTSPEDTATDPTNDPTLEGTGTAGTTASDTVAEADAETTSLSAGSNATTDTGVCVEPDEPNDTEDTSVPLDAIECQSSAMIDSTALGMTTPDWFAFHGEYDVGACGGSQEDYAEPRVTVIAGAPVEVCAYVTCAGASAVFCALGIEDTSPDGLAGCCAKSDAHLVVDCPGGADESTDVFVSVDTTGVECSDYTLQLSF